MDTQHKNMCVIRNEMKKKVRGKIIILSVRYWLDYISYACAVLGVCLKLWSRNMDGQSICLLFVASEKKQQKELVYMKNVKTCFSFCIATFFTIFCYLK